MMKADMRSLRRSGLALIAVTAAAPIAVARVENGSAASSVTAQQACTTLANKTMAAATVVEAVEVPAKGGVPKYCKVLAKIQPALNFELRIPDSWNGKFHYGGGGGYNGSIPPLYGATIAALRKGYITVGSDSGHQASGFDATWAIGDPHAEELYGHLSVPTVMSSALEMIEFAYGKAPARSYFEGCSNGGREGLIAAQRYPNLFDGIIAGCPVIGMPALEGLQNRTVKALAAPEVNFTPAKVKLMSDAVLAACDADDGIADGVVANPAACKFDPRVLRCPGGAGDKCLSDAQLAVVASWTSPAEFAHGAIRYPGFELTGNEGDQYAWDYWVLPKEAPMFMFQDSGIKGLIERDAKVNSLAYDFNSNPAALSRMTAILDPTNTDLRPFRNSDAKLILWHGGTDMALSHRMTTEHYEDVVQTVGGRASTDAFVNYYILPGVGHCFGGRGADSIDWLEALDDWVTKGTPPGDLTAAKLAQDGSTSFSRPVCKYPQYPRYTGPANDADAAKLADNYVCTTP